MRRLIAPLRKEMDEQATQQATHTETPLRAGQGGVSEENVAATLSQPGEKAGQALPSATNFFHTAGLLVLNLWIEKFVQALFEANVQFISTPGDDEKICYFYVDGHFDPYFGKLGKIIAKCNLARRLVKAIYWMLIRQQPLSIKGALDSTLLVVARQAGSTGNAL